MKVDHNSTANDLKARYVEKVFFVAYMYSKFILPCDTLNL